MIKMRIDIALLAMVTIALLAMLSCVCVASDAIPANTDNISEFAGEVGNASLDVSEMALINSAGVDGAFLYISGIQGESTDINHRNWIDVASFGSGIINPATTHMGGGAGAGKVSFDDLSVIKTLDKASPILYRAIGLESHYKEAKLELVKSGKVIMQYKLADVQISSAQMGGPLTNGSPMPMETISLNYARIVWTYYQYNEDGRLMGTVMSGWDVATGEEYIEG